MKICKDCKWAKRNLSSYLFFEGWKFAKCTHYTSFMGANLITGKSNGFYYCIVQRGDLGSCEKIGIFFEAKK